MSPTLQELRAELHAIRAKGGYGSASKGKEAFDRLGAEAARQGRPLGMLNQYSPDEEERFFSRTVPGPDGHVYWTGGKDFVRNDGKNRSPSRWWWAHRYGPLGQFDQIGMTCGDRACINPEHYRKESRGERRRRYTNNEMIGALQVAAMRLGHSPTCKQFDSLGDGLSSRNYEFRFGSWSKALAAAGLATSGRGFLTASPATAIASLRHARKILGHWPLYSEFISPRVKAELHKAGLPSAPVTIRVHLGQWHDALRKAGKR